MGRFLEGTVSFGSSAVALQMFYEEENAPDVLERDLMRNTECKKFFTVRSL